MVLLPMVPLPMVLKAEDTQSRIVYKAEDTQESLGMDSGGDKNEKKRLKIRSKMRYRKLKVLKN